MPWFLALCTYRGVQIIVSKLRCYLVREDWLRLLSFSKVVVLLLLICCLLLLSLIAGGSVFNLCFVMQKAVSFLVLQAS